MSRLTVDFNSLFAHIDPMFVVYSVGVVCLWAIMCAAVVWLVRGGE